MFPILADFLSTLGGGGRGGLGSWVLEGISHIQQDNARDNSLVAFFVVNLRLLDKHMC
jgi:hypothetical protein